MISGVARHNFKRRQLSPPLPKKTGVREFWIFFEFCIAVGEFWYIFGEIKQTFLSPKTGVWSIVPWKIFEFCIAVGEFWYILENENKLSSPLKRGSGALSPGKFLNSALL